MKSRYLPWLLLILAAVLALVFSGFQSGQDDTLVKPVARSRTDASLRGIVPRTTTPDAGNAALFGATPEEAPASGQSESAQEGEISNPPLLWRVIGKQHDGSSGWSVFLARDELTMVARVGDVLDDGYRIVSIAPPTMIVGHVTQDTRRAMDIGEAQ